MLAAADRNDVAAVTAATSTSAWLAHATVRAPGAAHADVRLATALDESFCATRAALAAGTVDGDQARVIVRAVGALPPDAVTEEPGLPARAEQHLLRLAGDHDAKRLQQLARHLHAVLDPEGADERLGRELEAEEARAARRTSLDLRDNGDGTHTATARIGTLHAAMLTKALEAILNPRRIVTGEGAVPGAVAGAVAGGQPPVAGVPAAPPPSRPEQLGQAFCELLERFPADRLPESGGISATVVVTLDLEALLSGLGTATLDTGERISAALARRLACEAGVIPAVVRRLVDGRSVVLDMGQERRLHTRHMRIALGLQHGGCTAEGCARPPGWCHAHHDLPWSRSGPTSVANGRLLCAFHHGKAHSSVHDVTHLPDGRVRFTRRTVSSAGSDLHLPAPSPVPQPAVRGPGAGAIPQSAGHPTLPRPLSRGPAAIPQSAGRLALLPSSGPVRQPRASAATAAARPVRTAPSM